MKAVYKWSRTPFWNWQKPILNQLGKKHQNFSEVFPCSHFGGKIGFCFIYLHFPQPRGFFTLPYDCFIEVEGWITNFRGIFSVFTDPTICRQWSQSNHQEFLQKLYNFKIKSTSVMYRVYVKHIYDMYNIYIIHSLALMSRVLLCIEAKQKMFRNAMWRWTAHDEQWNIDSPYTWW